MPRTAYLAAEIRLPVVACSGGDYTPADGIVCRVTTRKAFPRLAGFAHRKGVARMLNSSSNNMSSHCTAYVETRGPRWAAARLAVWALRQSARGGVSPRPDLDSIRVSKVEHVERFVWRIHLTFTRVGW